MRIKNLGTLKLATTSYKLSTIIKEEPLCIYGHYTSKRKRIIVLSSELYPADGLHPNFVKEVLKKAKATAKHTKRGTSYVILSSYFWSDFNGCLKGPYYILNFRFKNFSGAGDVEELFRAMKNILVKAVRAK